MSYDVLVVDDDPVVGALLTALIARAGWKSTALLSAEAGLERLTHQPFDLVISDVNMPGMTGLELHDRIRSDVRFARLPIVLLSATTDAATSDRQGDGLTLALTKPVRPSSFVTEVRDWMQALR